jgi:hypothetical protein
MRELPKNVVVVDTEPVWVKNPYSGDGVMLEPDAVAVYDYVKGCEMLRDYDGVRKGCNWFMENEPEAYMVLLD